MGRDYYGVLNVPRTATAEEVRQGYRWAAMKWHPQKNPTAKSESEQRFRDIAEAYDVLVDPLRRRRYDEVGERGLKFPIAGSGQQPYQYVGDPYAFFASFFAEANPLAAAYGQDLEGCAPSLSNKETEKPVEVEMQCSLVELQDGANRRIVVERTRLGPGMKPYQESKPITLAVRPGWEAGMRVTFRGEGNHANPAKLPGDLIIVITEMPFPGSQEGTRNNDT
eukprot:CAMPEP_0179255504 /NCGR_PEP_ID=MMETSP0797-20121207/23783_1 /TAXON_ID=47934 /ORGANISM="Dinophysis acuminata, Strain DAEP01" /LENGTH=222 /DNA_ID=CAMNT_0020963405 /DNA_START=72 /DNA_END=740 /DNA_ORIENTATION=-